MSRSGYIDEWDENWRMIMYRGAVNSAMKGKRGQAFLKEMLASLEALPEKKLVSNDLESYEGVCAIGAVGKKRGIDMTNIDPEDIETVSGKFGIADSMAREIVYENDEGDYWGGETPEERYDRMYRWIKSRIKDGR